MGRVLNIKRQPVTIIEAAAVRDARRVNARPGAIAVRGGRVIAAGKLNDLPRRMRARARYVRMPGHLVMPAMVNAHAHLDLSAIGPVPYPGDFLTWLKQTIARRSTEAQAIREAVYCGLEQSRDAGVGYVGDIAGSPEALNARQHAPDPLKLPGVSYLEFLGIGTPGRDLAQHLEATLDQYTFEAPVPGHVRGSLLGIGPHAPYSTDQAVYEQATRLSQERVYRLSTHLAESPQEIQFVRDGAGPFVQMLKDMGKWDDVIRPAGEHPVDALADCLRRGRWLVAHCNYVDERHIGILKRTGASVAYCPLASDYFGHRQHRYREMLERGINVCLGTDAILCQPPDEPQPLGILAQMRYLYHRDAPEPNLLLKMATTNGCLALEFRDVDATLQRHAPAAFCAVRFNPDDGTDPLVQVLQSNEPAEPLRLQVTEDPESQIARGP